MSAGIQPRRYRLDSRLYTPAQLAERPEARAHGLDRKVIAERLRTGWKPRAAISTPINAPHKQPGALIDGTTRYADDITAQLFVQMHPDGAPMELVGAMFGVTRERIRQIEASALDSLRKRLRLAGVDEADLATVVAQRARREVWA